MVNSIYVIFTTSAFECPWCVKAKALLDEYECEYEERDINVDALWKLDFKELGHKTVPQIYYDGDYIGGYEKLRKHFEDRD